MEYKAEIELSTDGKRSVESILADLLMFSESPHISEESLRESIVDYTYRLGSLLDIEIPDWKEF